MNNIQITQEQRDKLKDAIIEDWINTIRNDRSSDDWLREIFMEGRVGVETMADAELLQLASDAGLPVSRIIGAEPLTPEAYVKAGGARCPVCGSRHLEGDDVDIQEGKAIQNVDCLDCESTWVDTYTLAGYVELEITKDD